MLELEYLPSQRINGTFNGVFHEDGTVYSIEDAQAVAGTDKLEVVEKKTMPEWFVKALSEI